ncbi:unnamed protein product, partial [Scytosiphon promiscuus]
EAGAGLARLGDEDASAVAEELCVSGGEVGLRAALRLRERLAEENRDLTREARLRLLEALAGATGRALGDVIFESSGGRGLTLSALPTPRKKKKPKPPVSSVSSVSSGNSTATASSSPSTTTVTTEAAAEQAAAEPAEEVVAIAQPDPAWYANLRATARRAWGSGGEVDADGSMDLDLPPLQVQESGGGGWVPIGARAAGGGRAEVDGEGALVPAFDARIAARLAQELFSEMTAGKEAGRVSSRAQASLVRASFRSTLARSRGPAPPASLSDLADRTRASFDEADLELALSAGQAVADKLKIKKPTAAAAAAKSTAAAATSSANKKKGGKKVSAGQATAAGAAGAAAPGTIKKGKKGGKARGGDGVGQQPAASINGKSGSSAGGGGAAGSEQGGGGGAVGDKVDARSQPKNKKAEKAAASASRAGEMGGFWTASTLLQESLACNYTAGAELVLEAMGKERQWARTTTYNSLLWYCRQERDAKGALAILQSLRESDNATPDQMSYTLAIQACVWSGSCMEEAWAISIREVGAGTRTSSQLMLTRYPHAPVRISSLHPQAIGGDVLEGLREMSARGVTADESTMLGVIEACAERGDTKGALDGTAASCPRPSYRSYRAALTACSKALPPGDWRGSKEVLRMMWEDEAARVAKGDVAVPGTWSPGLQEALSLGPSHVTMPAVPDAACYQLAMECCVSRGRVDEALALLAERRWRGVENALGVFEELAERFDPPSRASFEQAIDACVSHPDGLQHAGDLISRMKAVGHDLQSDHYNVLIRGFGAARNLGAALNVFQTM